jgi:hypothetical protein
VLIKDRINYRKPDSDEPGARFRLYEIAGMPHNPAWRHPAFAGSGIAESCNAPLNDFPYEPLVSTALDHLIRWVGKGVLPPRAEPIALLGTPDDPIGIARDEHGNALGGVRTTTLDVPVATHRALNEGQGIPGIGDCLVFGSQMAFSREKLQSLYGSHSSYVNQVDERLSALLRQGWYLEEFADLLRNRAANFTGFESP